MRNRLTICLLILLILAPLAAAQSVEIGAEGHLAKAVELRGQAVAAYGIGDYDGSAELARQAKAELALMKGAAAPAAKADATVPLPSSYAVRLIDGDRDCLSKIAGYDFVYGDREKWIVLYKANKDSLKHPENADLILPGEILLIPSIDGETREEAWSPDKEYPNFKATTR